jgi:uncharacterized lipoprotein YmbA
VAWVLGCGSSPEPTFYALGPTAGPTGPQAQASLSRVIEVRRPALAGYLDRPGIVTRVADYRLRVVSEERWGEPLADMMARVLAQDLAERLPGSTVVSEASGMSADPDVLVELEVRRFDVGDDGDLVLLANVGVQPARGRAATVWTTLVLKTRPASAGTASLVAAMSGLLGRLADGIVPRLHD